MSLRKFLLFALALGMVTFTACSDDDDDKVTKDDNGGEEHSGVEPTYSDHLSLDASDYSVWTYINLKTGEMETLQDFSEWNYISGSDIVKTKDAEGSEDDITIDWHIAIHRYDIRTNNGSAVETEYTKFSDLTEIPTSGYEEDVMVENEIITDMTDMMTGTVGYAAVDLINPVLCGWLESTPTGSMPPYTYEPTGLVYVAKFEDGSYAKLLFTDYTNDMGSSGYVVFSWEYYEE